MERWATLAVAIVATTVIACGSTTSTSTQAPRTRDPAVTSEQAPDEPAALPPDASPPAPPSVTLAELAATMKSTGSDGVIAGLADLGLTVRCPTEGWKRGRAGVRETARCPAGAVQLGDVQGTLDVWVSRRIEDGSAPGASISVTATGEREQWARSVRALLLQERNAADEISALNDEPLPYFVGLGGRVRAYIMDKTDEPLRLVLKRHSPALLH